MTNLVSQLRDYELHKFICCSLREIPFPCDCGGTALLEEIRVALGGIVEPTPKQHSVVHALGVTWRVHEDPNMHPDCFILNGRAFRMTDTGLIELE